MIYALYTACLSEGSPQRMGVTLPVHRAKYERAAAVYSEAVKEWIRDAVHLCVRIIGKNCSLPSGLLPAVRHTHRRGSIDLDQASFFKDPQRSRQKPDLARFLGSCPRHTQLLLCAATN
jgi:hypothetical protein